MERYFAKLLAKNKFLGLIEIGRPWNGLLCSLAALIGFFTVSASVDALTIILIILSALFIYLAGSTINDLMDAKIDDITMPFRPLQQKRVTIKEALLFTVFMYSLSIVFSAVLGLKYLLIIIIFSFMSAAYSLPPFSFERRGLLSQIWLAFTMVFVPFYAGLTLAGISFISDINILLPFIVLSLTIAFIMIIKDFKDVEGDTTWGKKTVAVELGKKNALRLSMVGTLFLFPLSIYSLNNLFNNLLFVALSLCIFLLILYIESHTVQSEEAAFGKVRVGILTYMLLILIFSVITI